MNDLAKPVKTELPDYCALEGRVGKTMAQRFGTSYSLPGAVKIADKQMLAIEQYQVMRNFDTWPSSLPEETLPNVTIRFWKPMQAKNAFLQRFMEILAKRSADLAIIRSQKTRMVKPWSAWVPVY
jgi:hypothetical protein